MLVSYIPRGVHVHYSIAWKSFLSVGLLVSFHQIICFESRGSHTRTPFRSSPLAWVKARRRPRVALTKLFLASWYRFSTNHQRLLGSGRLRSLCLLPRDSALQTVMSISAVVRHGLVIMIKSAPLETDSNTLQ
jgi:hypothetical protein